MFRKKEAMMEENEINNDVNMNRVDNYIMQQLSCPPTPQECELIKINKRFNAIKSKLTCKFKEDEYKSECQKVLEILCSNEHRNNVVSGNDITKVSLPQDIRDSINRLIDECLTILNRIDYNNEISRLSDIFKDYCYRFNRLKECIN